MPHPAAHLVELLDLSRYEALLFSELVHAPAPLGARALIERVWGRRGNRNLFDITLRNLNRKLEGTGWTARSAAPGRGYKLARATSTSEA